MTKICIKVEEKNGKWVTSSICGKEYKHRVYESSAIYSKVDFYHEFEIEVRHAKEPKFVFEKLTKGYNKLDEKPENELKEGVVLLCISISMLCIGLYRLYQYCMIKFINKWMANKRVEKYLIEQEFENENYDEESFK